MNITEDELEELNRLWYAYDDYFRGLIKKYRVEQYKNDN